MVERRNRHSGQMNLTIWNENVHERTEDHVRAIYPDGIHGALAAALAEVGTVRTATLEQDQHGLPPEVLDATDVLTWWGHDAHEDVADDVVDRVVDRVHDGMGLVVLHSGHYSKPFRRLMGTRCTLEWRHDDRETVWTVAPGHPIAAGIPSSFVIPEQEMYGEFFDVPPPRGAGLHQLVRRRRGVPQRLLLDARSRAHLLLQPRPRDQSGLPPAGGPAGDRQCRALGVAGVTVSVGE